MTNKINQAAPAPLSTGSLGLGTTPELESQSAATLPVTGPVNQSTLDQNISDSVDRVQSARGGFSEGFVVTSAIKTQVKDLEKQLKTNNQTRLDAEQNRVSSRNDEGAAWGELTLWDKFFGWLPFGHDEEKIAAWESANGSYEGASSAEDHAQSDIARTKNEIRIAISDFLRKSPASTFAELEKHHDRMDVLTSAANRVRGPADDAMRKLDFAFEVQAWHSMSAKEQEKHIEFGGRDRSDFSFDTIAKEARELINTVEKRLPDFREGLQDYRPEITVSVGSLGSKDISAETRSALQSLQDQVVAVRSRAISLSGDDAIAMGSQIRAVHAVAVAE
ncbi:hypothetical protein KAI87_04065 [Myxococcota bacterium]|nr:hypothetical protein [Myxococcota bacterium]